MRGDHLILDQGNIYDPEKTEQAATVTRIIMTRLPHKFHGNLVQKNDLSANMFIS